MSLRPEPWPGWPLCPCGQCEVEGLKLNRFGHVVGCRCPSCRGRNNRERGKNANRRAHRALAPELERTIDDDIFHAYPIEVSLEVKSGQQVPASIARFCRSEWARHAWRQAERKVPVGVQASPAIYVELAPSEAFLVVRLGKAVAGKELP